MRIRSGERRIHAAAQGFGLAPAFVTSAGDGQGQRSWPAQVPTHVSFSGFQCHVRRKPALPASFNQFLFTARHRRSDGRCSWSRPRWRPRSWTWRRRACWRQGPTRNAKGRLMRNCQPPRSSRLAPALGMGRCTVHRHRLRGSRPWPHAPLPGARGSAAEEAAWSDADPMPEGALGAPMGHARGSSELARRRAFGASGASFQ